MRVLSCKGVFAFGRHRASSEKCIPRPIFCQLRIVVALEGIEVVGTHFGRAVSAPQIVLEQDSYFPDHRRPVKSSGGCNLQGGYEVFFSVGAHFSDGELRAGDNDRLVEIAEHE